MSTYSDTNRVGRNFHSLHNIWLKFYYMNKFRGKNDFNSVIHQLHTAKILRTNTGLCNYIINHIRERILHLFTNYSHSNDKGWLCIYQNKEHAGLRRKKENKPNPWHIPIVAIFNVLLWQLSCFRHLMPVRALSTSCALTPYVETAYMCPVSLVIWWGSLELQNGIIWPHLSVWRFIIYTSSGLQVNGVMLSTK